jgi:hypothetical protein
METIKQNMSFKGTKATVKKHIEFNEEQIYELWETKILESWNKRRSA